MIIMAWAVVTYECLSFLMYSNGKKGTSSKNLLLFQEENVDGAHKSRHYNNHYTKCKW